MITPLSHLLMAMARPQYKEVALKNSGLAEIVHPFVGFLLFCSGKILIAVFLLLIQDASVPGFLGRPFTIYVYVSNIALCPLGLHFFMAYQEFTFFSFCSIHKTFAKMVLETSKEEPKATKHSETHSNELHCNDSVQNDNLAVYHFSPREDLHCNLEEMIELMKNMTEAFGPPLLQNLTLMLLFWLLHVYCLVFVVISTVKALFGGSEGNYLVCGTIAGLVFIVR